MLASREEVIGAGGAMEGCDLFLEYTGILKVMNEVEGEPCSLIPEVINVEDLAMALCGHFTGDGAYEN